jgi:hypothetical protein
MANMGSVARKGVSRLTLLLAGFLTLAACGKASPSATPRVSAEKLNPGSTVSPRSDPTRTALARANYCGPPPVLATYAGRSLALTGCPGVLGTSPLPGLTAAAGGRIIISGLGENYTNLQSSDPKVLEIGATSSKQASLTALSSGTATLAVETPFCDGHTGITSCSSLIVHVTSNG